MEVQVTAEERFILNTLRSRRRMVRRVCVPLTLARNVRSIGQAERVPAESAYRSNGCVSSGLEAVVGDLRYCNYRET